MAKICCFCLSNAKKGRQKTRPPPSKFMVFSVAIEEMDPSHTIYFDMSVFVCVCVCLYVCMYVCRCVYIYIYMYAGLIRNSPDRGQSRKSDLVNFRCPDWRKFSELCVLLFVPGKIDKIFPKSRFSERIFGDSTATPRHQLNWTGPIANSSGPSLAISIVRIWPMVILRFWPKFSLNLFSEVLSGKFLVFLVFRVCFCWQCLFWGGEFGKSV